MIEIEWGAPIAANGRPSWLQNDDVVSAYTCVWHPANCPPSGLDWPIIKMIRLKSGHPYYTSTTTIPTALYERMAELCRRMGAFPPEGLVREAIDHDYSTAREIAKELPVEVDLDREEAEQIAKDWGVGDNRDAVEAVLYALRQGRQLERGE